MADGQLRTEYRWRSGRFCRAYPACAAPSNKGMKLTKLSAAWLPEWTCRLMPAPSRQHAGTASQLIPGVLRTEMRGAA